MADSPFFWYYDPGNKQQFVFQNLIRKKEILYGII